MFNRTIQMLAKLSQTIARESGEANGSTEMNSLLQICFDKLHHIQENLPIVLKRNKILLGYLQKLDDGLPSWLNDAEQLLGEHSIQVSVLRINESLEQHRVGIAVIIIVEYLSFLLVAFLRRAELQSNVARKGDEVNQHDEESQ